MLLVESWSSGHFIDYQAEEQVKMCTHVCFSHENDSTQDLLLFS